MNVLTANKRGKMDSDVIDHQLLIRYLHLSYAEEEKVTQWAVYQVFFDFEKASNSGEKWCKALTLNLLYP